MDATLPRDERLRTSGALKRLFEQGRGGFVYPFRYIFVTAGDADAAPRNARVLFSVPKRFHKRANKRNLLRRRTKEAYRLNKTLLHAVRTTPIDLALIYSVKDVVEYKRIEDAVKRVLSQIAGAL
ncbi:MAG: ribonuclease P protein component [Alistipes sp.]|nr:ribonuclease P protein component [Alistipes sp.]